MTPEPNEWDALVPDDNPFLEHAFLFGLEASGSVGTPESGWVPRHILYREAGRLVGAMPLYEKYDSYGEYIFDWSWAQASERAGIPYYPKLVSAVPFTPVTGPRLLGPERVHRRLLDAARTAAESASSLHVLFCTELESRTFAAAGMAPRLSSQFHWQRRWPSYEGFLAALRAPARKQLRRERQQAAAHGLELTMQRSPELDDRDWRALWRFYRSTAERKGAIPYLTEAFFERLRAGGRVVAAFARRAGEPVAGAMFLAKGTGLFGRYWGADLELPALHFELCYNRPIEWAFANGITRFEAGAQGEHKHKRGLTPALTYSAHWLRHAGLAVSVQRFIEREARAVQQELEDYAAHGPFKRGASGRA